MQKILTTLSALLAFIGTFTIIGVNPPSREDDELVRGRSGAMQALEFWSDSRAYPQNDIPNATYFKEYEKATMAAKERRFSTHAITSWHSIGPNNLSGRALSIAVNPQNHNTVYVGTASGGLWRSRTSGLGADWERVSTGYPVLGVSAIAIDPTDSNTIFIGTGEVYRYGAALGGLVIRTTRGSFGIGILKTTNSGVTWTKSLDWSTEQQRGIQAVKFNPLNPRTIYAGTTEGLYKSSDGGVTWDILLDYLLAEDFVVNPLDTNLMIVSTGNFRIYAGLSRTTDGGATWNLIAGLPAFTGKTLLELYGGNPNVVYADIADDTTGAGSLWKSTDFGINWTLLDANPGIYGVQGWYSHFVTAHPTDSNQIFQASVGWRKSTNGGVSFNGASSGSYSDHHSYAHDPADPNILYVVNDDGPYRSTDFGTSFTYIGVNLPTGQFYNGFSNSSTDSLLAIGQVQDHIPGYIYHGSVNWGRGVVDEVGWTAIDPTNDFIMYAMDRNGGGVYKSSNRGGSFPVRKSLGAGDGAWNSPLVVSHSQPAVLYAATTRVYKSIDGAGSFFATNVGAVINGNPAISLAVSATNSDTVLVGLAPLNITPGGVFRTTNGGTSWTNVTGILPDRYPLDIAFDPKNSQVAYSAFGGFDAGHIFKTTNTGGSWFDVTGTLPNVPTGAVLVDQVNSDYVYAGNDIGVYVSTNGGVSWSSFSEGLPEAVLVSDLSYTPSNKTLRATTHGNGIFERKLEGVLPAVTVLTPNGGESIESGIPYPITWGFGLVSSIRIEYSTNNGGNWLQIADNVPASLGSYMWRPPYDSLLPQVRVRVTADENAGVTDESDAVFTIFFGGVLRSVTHGWNLVSMGVNPPDPAATVMFPTAISQMFDYEGSYQVKTILQPERGYWDKYNAPQNIGMKGTSITTLTIGVIGGWNLFGSLSVPISVSQVTSDPPGNILRRFFTYDGSHYVEASTLFPGYGYWVHADGPATITLSSAGIAAKQENEIPEDLPSNHLTITDKAGNVQILYLGIEHGTDERKTFGLPPIPPGDAFEIRFSSNTTAEFVRKGESRSFPIHLQGISYPMTLSWQMNEDMIHAALAQISRGERALSGSGSMTIEDAPDGVMTLKVSTGAQPAIFSLAQNYPNPFNPSTEIAYDIVNRGKVSLKIFDVLGKEVATLVDGVKEPGSYAITWNAEGVPSGMYIYRLTSGAATQSRKLLIIR